MTSYRVYSLSSAGRIMSATWIEADDDDQAQAAASGFCTPDIPSIELWCGARRVGTFDCPPPPAAPS